MNTIKYTQIQDEYDSKRQSKYFGRVRTADDCYGCNRHYRVQLICAKIYILAFVLGLLYIIHCHSTIFSNYLQQKYHKIPDNMR